MKYIVGLSGGVDSAVCAGLLKNAGHDVLGVFLDTGHGNFREAKAVAGSLGVEFDIIDVKKAMLEKVIEPYTKAHRSGITPNPCIICNPTLKFPALLETMRKWGYDKIATGHYAVIHEGELYRSTSNKDQSYMLYRLPKAFFEFIEFPLGKMEKPEIRNLARDMKIPVAEKKDSMDLCFPFEPHLKKYRFFDRQGKLLGEKLCTLTIGQRAPVSAGERLYVSSIKDNEALALSRPSVMRTVYELTDTHMLCDMGYKSFKASVKLRHGKDETDGTITLSDNSRARVELISPAFCGAPGQSAVFYNNNKVLGGGIISVNS